MTILWYCEAFICDTLLHATVHQMLLIVLYLFWTAIGLTAYNRQWNKMIRTFFQVWICGLTNPTFLWVSNFITLLYICWLFRAHLNLCYFDKEWIIQMGMADDFERHYYSSLNMSMMVKHVLKTGLTLPNLFFLFANIWKKYPLHWSIVLISRWV